MILYAAVSDQDRAVWGVGASTALAVSNARQEEKGKRPGICIGGRLRVVELPDNAPIEEDGIELYKFLVKHRFNVMPGQQDLFGGES